MIGKTSFAAVPEWVLEHPAIRETPTMLVTYCALYMEGNYKDRTCEFSCQSVMARTGLSRAGVYKHLKAMTDAGIVVKLPDGTYWMPLDDSATAERVSTTVDKVSTTVDRKSTTVDKSENSPITNTEIIQRYRESDAHVEQLLALLLERVTANGFRPFTVGERSRGAMRRLLEVDKRDPREVETVIEWCQRDEFWLSNIRSPEKLREKYDTLLGQMMRGKRGMMAFLQGEDW